MKKRFKYCVMVVCFFFTLNVSADFIYSDKYVEIDEIDLVTKVVYYTENGKNYKSTFDMGLFGDVFYTNDNSTDKKSLSDLPLEKKYYINLRSVVDENNKNNKNFIIYYIGIAPYPF